MSIVRILPAADLVSTQRNRAELRPGSWSRASWTPARVTWVNALDERIRCTRSERIVRDIDATSGVFAI
jgi:hypothetical protein